MIIKEEVKIKYSCSFRVQFYRKPIDGSFVTGYSNNISLHFFDV